MCPLVHITLESVSCTSHPRVMTRGKISFEHDSVYLMPYTEHFFIPFDYI